MRRELLAVLGAGGARDALVHQRATEIVGAGLRSEERRAASMIAAELEPIVLTPPRRKAAVG